MRPPAGEWDSVAEQCAKAIADEKAWWAAMTACYGIGWWVGCPVAKASLRLLEALMKKQALAAEYARGIRASQQDRQLEELVRSVGCRLPNTTTGGAQ